jgi:hypothetical protein
MVDFQLDIQNKLHPDGEEPKGLFYFHTKTKKNIRNCL